MGSFVVLVSMGRLANVEGILSRYIPCLVMWEEFFIEFTCSRFFASSFYLIFSATIWHSYSMTELI